MNKQVISILSCLFFCSVSVGMVNATPFSIMVGDNDGYGLGIADNGTATWGSFTPQDWRSVSEQGATDGAQATDIYGVLWDSPPTAIDIVFNLSDVVLSAILTVDMADAQARPIGISYNGVAQSPWNYNDGFQNTVIRSYNLDLASIANANTAGSFTLTIGTNAPVADFLAFDYFKLEGEYASAPVPEPSTILLFGFGLAGLVGFSRRKKK